MDVGFVIPLAVLIALSTVIGIGVYLAVRVRAGTPLVLSFQSILLGYFYLMALVSFLFLAVGLSSLLKAGMSQPFGRSFSYYVPDRNLPAPVKFPDGSQTSPEEIRRQQLAQVEQQFRNDLVQGGTATVFGLVLWPLHLWGRRRLVSGDDPFASYLSRTFLVIPLVLFSLIGISTLITAVFQLLSFLVAPADSGSFQAPPGGAVATAVVFVPLWAHYVLRISRLVGPPAT